MARVAALAPGACVWLVWAIMFIATFAFMRHNAVNIPYWDEWNAMVPVVTGERPVTLPWLWSQHNEHRIFLPRLVYVALAKLTCCDFRAGKVFNVVALALLAAMLMVAARKSRGRWSFCDAVFPLAFLNWANGGNFLFGFQVAFICPVILAAMILVAIVRCQDTLSRGSIVLVGSCLVLLPLCGGAGLALALPLALWLSWVAIRNWSTARSTAITGLSLAGMTLFLTAFYFVGYQKPGHHQVDPPLESVAQTALQFGTMCWGPGVIDHWNASVWALCVFLLATVGLLAVVSIGKPGERTRAAGLFLYLVGFVTMALGIGWGRGAMSELAGFELRYTTLAVPLLGALYFAWTLYGGPIAGRMLPAALLLMSCFFLWPNMAIGMQYAEQHRLIMRSFEHHLKTGMSAGELAERYEGKVFAPKHLLLENLKMLHRAGVGYFRDMPVGSEIRGQRSDVGGQRSDF